jgi:choline dehydrogenase
MREHGRNLRIFWWLSRIIFRYVQRQLSGHFAPKGQGTTKMESYDYVIVGGGSAGCVLAEKLTRSGRHKVLLLEAGGPDRSPWIGLPLGYGKLFYHPTLNWQYRTEADEGLGGREGYWPRGKVIGGSGSINAMVYARGLPTDFDDWEAAGATGWGWKTVAQVYDQLETQVAPDGTERGTGPIHVQDVSDQIHPTNRHFFAATTELGLRVTQNMNGPEPEGAAVYRINTHRGRRDSSARAYLATARGRANLRIVTHAHVDRLGFEGRRAASVSYRRQGQEVTVRAGREIILSAGAVATPLILQRSGLGPEAVLQQAGIAPLVDLRHVGENLQDHLAVSYYYRATEPTLNNDLAPLWGKIRAAIRYALTRKGPLALSVNQCGGYFRSDPGLNRPDQQLYFNPVTYTTRVVEGRRTVINPDAFPGFIICHQPCRPTSRGRIAIAGADPFAAPRIMPNSLSTEEDREAAIAGGRLCRDLVRTKALDGLIASSMDPTDLRQMDDAAILEDFRARCGTVYHPVGTCRMGQDAGASVVDPSLRVHGIAGLRVIDASVFPNVTSANTNAPTMMLAHRAADLVLEDA